MKNLPWHKMMTGWLLFLGSNGLGVDEAVDRNYLHRIWQFADGLPQNVVQAVIQTRDGYLWAGTQNGLARFDGVTFKVFDSVNTPEIKNSIFTCFFETKDGALWMGTEGGGVVRLKDGKFASYAKTEGLAGNIVRAICETKDGVLWVGTTEGVSIFQQGRFAPVSVPGWKNDLLVRAFYEDPSGNLWLGANAKGLFSYRNGVLSFRPNDTAMTDSVVRTICVDRQQTVWYGTSEGLYKMTAKGKIRSFTKKHGLPGIVLTIFEDRRGQLWIGTYGGLARLENDQFVIEQTAEGMSFDAVYSICEDREGNLWVGTKEGLNRLAERPFQAYSQKDGLAANNIVSVCEGQNGQLWVGTWGGGVSQLAEGKLVRNLTRDVYGFKNDLALGLCEARDGSLWIGFDFDAGLARLRQDQATHYWRTEGLVDSAVKVIYEDRARQLWLGTRTALYRFAHEKFTRFTKTEGIAGNMVRVILEDVEGRLWFGTDEGLTRYQEGKFTNFTTQDGLSANNIAALWEDREGTLWIGTVGGGLNRLRREPKSPTPTPETRRAPPHFTAYRMAQGMFRNDVFEILEDDFGYFWMTCRLGVYRVAKRQFDELDAGKISALTSVAYGKRDGLISLECNSVAKPSACKTRDGRLWFATAKGLVTVDPRANCEINRIIPPVYIEKIVADGKSITPDHQPGEPGQNVKSSFPLRLPPGRGEMEFHFTALSYSAPEENRFKYRLEGFDQQWVNAGSRRMAQYANLRPGHYRFRVIGSNNDGVWNETGTVFAFHLAPHFYQAGWFYLVGGLGLVGAILGIHRLRVNHLQTRARQLAFLVAERTRHLKNEITEREKAQAQIETVHRQLLDTSRQAGMAEVASGVLHNVGNVLNSVNVSATCAMDKVRHSRQTGLHKVVTLLQENSADLAGLFTRDEKGRQLPAYLAKLSEHLDKEQAAVVQELESVCKNIDHIKDIVALQQNYAQVSGLVESLNLQELVEDSLRMNAAALARHDVQVAKNFAAVPTVTTDKHKVLQILVNLIRNAKYACDGAETTEKRVTISLQVSSGNRIQIRVSDNGVGIPPENLTRIFSHGFTTRKDGHGFGLHSSALTARELGGSLSAESDGPGSGAAFTLELPLKLETSTK